MSFSSDPGPSERPMQRANTWTIQPQDDEVREAWNRRNLLSLDGGGIRGYWSLLVLLELMKTIAAEERTQAEMEEDQEDQQNIGLIPQTRFHSFYPLNFPPNVTQGPWTKEESAALRVADSDERKFDAYGDSRKFLPCHYFDMICGSSTGGLIAIMLGRFRMTVEDCLHEYRSMGNKIFGRPRLISQRNVFIVPWTKYSAENMEKAFKSVTARRCGRDENRQGDAVIFPTIQGTCKTFVSTLRRKREGEGEMSIDKPYLIRSYDYAYAENSQRQDSDNQERGCGSASRLEIWQIARAATAAPMYFKQIKLKSGNPKTRAKYYFTDGGFGHNNNPTLLGIEELKQLHGQDNIGVVVSIGTSRNDNRTRRNGAVGTIIFAVARATDPRLVGDQLGAMGLPDYHRYNDENGVDVELDEWKPSGWRTKEPGKETLTKIENHFYKWVVSGRVQEDFKKCAEKLVRRRRQRSRHKSLWERYAYGAEYRCHDCAAHFVGEEEFQQHSITTHGGPGKNAVSMWRYQSSPQ